MGGTFCVDGGSTLVIAPGTKLGDPGSGMVDIEVIDGSVTIGDDVHIKDVTVSSTGTFVSGRGTVNSVTNNDWQ